jgi:hypothetical protein
VAEAEKQRQQHLAAVMFQSLVRGQLARRLVKKMQTEMEVQQRIQARLTQLRLNLAARTLQRFVKVRCMVVWEKKRIEQVLRFQQERRVWACLTIQSMWRGLKRSQSFLVYYILYIQVGSSVK